MKDIYAHQPRALNTCARHIYTKNIISIATNLRRFNLKTIHNWSQKNHRPAFLDSSKVLDLHAASCVVWKEFIKLFQLNELHILYHPRSLDKHIQGYSK